MKRIALTISTCVLLVLAIVVSDTITARMTAPAAQIPISAATTAMVKPAPVNWSDQVCHALEAWETHHHDATDLYRLTVDAAHLPKGYLKADMLELAADVSSPSPNAWQYVSVAEQYAGEDCFGGA